MSEETKRRDRFTTALVVVVVVIGAALRINLLDVPLERDEGEYAYLGQRLLQGEAPWVHAWNMKLPGASLAYALMMALFGHNRWRCRLRRYP